LIIPEKRLDYSSLFLFYVRKNVNEGIDGAAFYQDTAGSEDPKNRPAIISSN